MRRAPGLRLQIVLAVAGLMALAFVPLFFAVASLTRVTLHGLREDSARALGRAVASHAAETDFHDAASLKSVLESDTGKGGVDAVCVYDQAGAVIACAGDEREIASMRAPAPPFGERTEDVRGATGSAVDVTVPSASGVVVARLRTGDAADRAAPLVRLVAVYMTAFGLAFAFVVYVALTRLIVRPVEALARATDRVATGARKLDLPPAGASELVELSSSVNTMTTRLFAEEEKLRRKVDELTETTRRLTEAQAHLVRSERLASVGRLAAGMAHEIGNPITAIMGIEELLIAGDVPADEQAEYLARMRKETERIHKILRDLLDFARPESRASAAASGSLPAALESAAGSVVLSEAVGDVLSLLKPQKVFRDVEVSVDVPGDLEVQIAKDRLEQVLLNLALNACDAMAGSETKKLSLRAARKDGGVRIEIEDTGPGVAEEVRERLFLPFVTTKEVGLGTGLGLAVCRGIVEGAGGRIDLDTAAPRGARFVVFLPAHVV